MEVIEIYFDKTMGKATLIDASALFEIWKIEVGEKYLIVENSYMKAETYTLKEHSHNIDIKKAMQQVPVIMWQIDQFKKKSRPKPPKRYR